MKQGWFKTYIDSLEDIKFKKLEKKSDCYSHYVLLWELMKNESAKGGGVIECDPDDWPLMFDKLTRQISEPEVIDYVYDMEEVGLIEIADGEIRIKNWEKYQSETLSTGRVQKHRVNKELEDTVTSILHKFNEITGKRYSTKTEGSRELIRGRLNEGRTEAELVAVIKNRYDEWKNDRKMEKFIRPSTVFRPTNFDNYLNQVPVGKVKALHEGTLLRVRNMNNVVMEITQEQYDKAADGYYTILDD